jgi:hypothetical protein
VNSPCEKSRAGNLECDRERNETALNERFDELVKALAQGVSRRQALRRVAGALAGALLAGWEAGKAAAQGASANCDDHCRSFYDPRQSPGDFRACISHCAECQECFHHDEAAVTVCDAKYGGEYWACVAARCERLS